MRRIKLTRKTKLVITVLVVIVVLGLITNALISMFESSTGFESPSSGAIPLPTQPTEKAITQTATLAFSPAPEARSSTRLEIFKGTMTVEVKDVRGALAQIAVIAQQLGGYVSGSSSSIVKDKEVATITIRVPQEKFHSAISAIEVLGTPKSKITHSDDITQEFIDLKARRDNLIRQEKRLQEILALGKTVEEILKVEKELERVRGEIERLTARINYLENLAALSTITTTFMQPVETPLPELDWLEPFKAGIGFLYATYRGLVILVLAIFPLALIGVPSYLFYRYWRSRQAKAVAG